MTVAQATVVLATNRLFAKDSRIREISANARKCVSVNPPFPSVNAVYTTVKIGPIKKMNKNNAMAIAIAIKPGWLRFTVIQYL